jgi:hypothetical protein
VKVAKDIPRIMFKPLLPLEGGSPEEKFTPFRANSQRR